MSDYATKINVLDYRERQPVYLTNITNQTKYNVPIKFILNDSNFNFNTARPDGLDLRLTESTNGSGCLFMWVASWDQENRRAIVWFKLPKLLPNETKTLYAFWGNADDTGISNLDSINNGIFREFSEDVCVSGTATGGAAPGDGSYPGLGNPADAFDDNYSSRYTCHTAPIYDIRPPIWLTYDFGPGVTRQVECVKIAVPNSYCPKDTIIQGSNDNINWDDLYSRTLPLPESGISDFFLTFYNDTAYRYIRIYFTNIWSSSLYIYEVEMYEVVSSEELTDGCFLFADDFDGDELDKSNWQILGNYNLNDSKLELNYLVSIETVNPILAGTTNWILYEGTGYHTQAAVVNTRLHAHYFLGGENEFNIDYYDTETGRYDNFEYGGSLIDDSGDYRGIEINSSQLNYVAYVEETDFVYQGMLNRATYPDYNDTWERKVHRNTWVEALKILGKNNSAQSSLPIDWVVITEYDPENDPVLDISNLLIPYETIPHQLLDYTDYTTDITSVDFFHSSDVGGDPYHLSDNITNSIARIWISDEATTSGSLIIDFGRRSDNISSQSYLHLDNSHVEFYAAAKLSDRQTDVYGANYWQATTSSGVWAAIKFPTPTAVSCVVVRARESDLDGMIKDYELYTSNVDPRFSSEDEWVLVTSGTFSKIAQPQNIYLDRGRYYYYILKAINSYGNNVALEEWEFYEDHPSLRKRAVSQIRLYPVTIANQEYYFPKNIKLYGGNDGVNWTLLKTSETYTPFYDATYGRWQRFSVENNDAYYMYKLVVLDNWYATADQIRIAEWEMVEKVSEASNHRILFGTTDNISQIWADPTATFDDGNIYALNDVLNTIYEEDSATYTTVSGVVADMNIIV